MKYVATFAMTACCVSSLMAAPSTFDAAQTENIENIVHKYLVAHPEVLIEASQALQAKQQKEMQSQAGSAIESQAKNLFNEDIAIAGNPHGNVTLVEFFDYQCIHCKKMSSTVDSLIKKNPNLRVIYKEFPIFGQSSVTASEAALAATMQKHPYSELHNALIVKNERLTDEIVYKTAADLKLNVEQLKKDMKSKKINAALDANESLARALHLMGTPAFIIASTPNGELAANTKPEFIPGAASEATLQDLIQKVSGK